MPIPSWLALVPLLAAAEATPAPPPPEDDRAIIVRGIRLRGSVQGDIRPEQTLTQDDIKSRGVDTVGGLVDSIAKQVGVAGGGPPLTLLNGKRISGRQEINDIPAQAIARTDVLPAEAALAYGYPADQKLINIVLVPSFDAIVAGVTLTSGGRTNGAANATLQTIDGDNRLNVTLSASATRMLLESARDITPIASTPQFAVGGNLYGTIPPPPGLAPEIDPALSALAGMRVTLAAVPTSAAAGAPALAAFLPGANLPASSGLGAFRSLTPRARQYTASLAFARALGGVSAALSARLQRDETLSLQGLPGVSPLIPAGNPFSPFAAPVRLYRTLDAAGPLSQTGRTHLATLGATLSGPIGLGSWTWNLTGSLAHANSRTATVRGIDGAALQAALDAGDPAVNPFGAIAPALLAARRIDRATGKSTSLSGDLLLSGPLLTLPAGPVSVSATLS